MIRIKADGGFSEALLQSPDIDVEQIMTDTISKTIANDIKNNIDDLEFIDIEPTVNGYTWEAKIVICSQAQVDTSIIMMVQRLKEKGLSDKDVEYCLEPSITDLGGF